MLPQVIEQVVHTDTSRGRVADLHEDRISAHVIVADDDALLKDQPVTGRPMRVGWQIVESVGEARSATSCRRGRMLVADRQQMPNGRSGGRTAKVDNINVCSGRQVDAFVQVFGDVEDVRTAATSGPTIASCAAASRTSL